jgi:formate-dependent nitrite reductase membrane component NrfD
MSYWYKKSSELSENYMLFLLLFVAPLFYIHLQLNKNTSMKTCAKSKAFVFNTQCDPVPAGKKLVEVAATQTL